MQSYLDSHSPGQRTALHPVHADLAYTALLRKDITNALQCTLLDQPLPGRELVLQLSLQQVLHLSVLTEMADH